MPDTKYTTNMGSSGSQFHERKLIPQFAKRPCSCDTTMSDIFRLPVTIRTTTSAKPIEVSYDNIWAAARLAPRNAYFEFDAQPARITPYTPTDEIAIT